jgi:hypothetical protein
MNPRLGNAEERAKKPPTIEVDPVSPPLGIEVVKRRQTRAERQIDRQTKYDARAWYYVEGVRYCAFCRTRRCKRQVGGNLECIREDSGS